MLCLLLGSALKMHAQAPAPPPVYDSIKIYTITKVDGHTLSGRILKVDDHDVLVYTIGLGRVAIPKYEISSIAEVKMGQLDKSGEYMGEDPFPGNYLFTSNAIPPNKYEFEAFARFSGIGINYGVTDHLSVGLTSVWFIFDALNVSYAGKLSDGVYGKLGLMAAIPAFSIDPGGVLVAPYGTLTFGNKVSNLSVTAGYFTYAQGNNELFGINNLAQNNFIMSVGGLKRISHKSSFLFDSYLIPDIAGTGTGLLLLLPGFRVQTGGKSAISAGIGMLSAIDNAHGNGSTFLPWVSFGYLQKF